MAAEISPEEAGAPAEAALSRARLWAEFGALYVGVPLALAFLLPADLMWPTLALCFFASLLLLRATPGFVWSELLRGPVLARPVALGVVTLLAVGTAWGLTAWLRPWALFWLPRQAPDLWLMIMVLYPLLSALPQEIAFRVLFFRRYGALFPSRALGVTANAVVFGLAHLFLWNWVAPTLTAVGGAVLAWAYLDGRGRNFLFPLLLHAIAGWVIFTIGLGLYFYHGAAG